MRGQATPAVPLPNAPGSPLRAPFDEPFWLWRLFIGLFAWIWKLIQGILVYFIVLGVGVSLAASWLTSQDNVNPSTWQVSQYLASLGQHLLVAVAVFGVLVAGAVAAWRADVVQQDWVERRRLGKESIRIEEERQRTEVAAESGAANAVARREGGLALEAYGPIPMPKLKPSNCGVSGKNFVESVYVERDADLQAREVLRKIARRAVGGENAVDESIIGIRLVGERNSGKSRLIWETLTHHLPELQGWHFLQWPLSEDRQFPFDMMKGQRVVVLLDRLEGYASTADPRVSRRLNRLRDQFDDGKIPLIIIATTYRDKAPEKLDDLLASLDEIELAPLTSAQAEKLTADLQGLGRPTHPFDEGTPGSITIGSASGDDYEQLTTEDARLVMRILKLFNSIGMGSEPAYITKARVSAVAAALFDAPTLRWRLATDELFDKHLVLGQLIPPNYERAITPINDEVLDIISDYPLGGLREMMELEDWPQLQRVFADTRDADALVPLGVAWMNSQVPLTDPSGPTKLDVLLRAADCFRSAIEILSQGDGEANLSTRALVQGYLADVLHVQNFYMLTTAESPTRLEVLQESARSYQAALEYFTRDRDPSSWTSLTSSLALTLNEQAKFLEGGRKPPDS